MAQAERDGHGWEPVGNNTGGDTAILRDVHGVEVARFSS
jgi:hypothetical protein